MTATAPTPLGAARREPLEGETHVGRLERQNAYLKLRCAQLDDDVVTLSSQVVRLQPELERLHGRRADASAGSQT